MDVKYEGGKMQIKKILAVGIIILFFSITIYPVITAIDSDTEENDLNYSNSIKINFQDSSKKRF